MNRPWARRKNCLGRGPGFLRVFCLIICLPGLGLSAQSFDLDVRGGVNFLFPLSDIATQQESLFSYGLGPQVKVSLPLLGFMEPGINLGYSSLVAKTGDDQALQLLTLGGQLGFYLDTWEGGRVGLNGGGGYYISSWAEDKTFKYLYWQAGIDLTTPVFFPWMILNVFANFQAYPLPPGNLVDGISVGATIGVNIDELANAGTGRLQLDEPKAGQVFPVFYAYYNDHSFGTVTVENQERNGITDVRVSFTMSQYMDQAKLCAQYPQLATGQKVVAPLYAIFSNDVLTLTENTSVAAEVVVDYRYLGEARQQRKPFMLKMAHRNAMTWDDDRHAAAFVSPTDPAGLWFSRYAASIVRDRLRSGINANLQYGMGIFEALQLFGVNYVVDPGSSYVAQSANEMAPDYLQFPSQSLFYRGGDCDDLSILMASLMESLNIPTAFITVPGHIFMAFSMEISEAEARKDFFDPSLLIFHGGKAWIPVEVTMIKDGFVKAWRVGAKEWHDNAKSGAAQLYAMADSWKLFPPVGVPGVNPRFSLPAEVATILAFDTAMDKYVAREIDPAIRSWVAANPGQPVKVKGNELGIIYGRFGMLKEAWAEFTKAAKENNLEAWNNLGNIAFLRKDYPLALSYYQYCLKQDPASELAMLGIARCQYEMERYEDIGPMYAQLQARNPELAGSYSYLVSETSGQGRAWSFADRLAGLVWAGKEYMALAKKRPDYVDPVEAAARKAAEDKASRELAARKAAEELAASKLAEAKLAKELADRKAAEIKAAMELAARQAAETKAAMELAARIAAEEKAAADLAATKAEEERLAAAAEAVKRKAAMDLAAQKAADEKAAADKAAVLAEQARQAALAEAEKRKAAELAAIQQAESEKSAENDRLLAEATAQRIAAETRQAEAEAARKEADRLAAIKAEADHQAQLQAEAERLAAEKRLAEAEAARRESERLAALKAEADRQAQIKAEAERVAAQKLAAEREAAELLAAQLAEADRLAREQAAAELAAQQAENDRLAQIQADEAAAAVVAAQTPVAAIEVPTLTEKPPEDVDIMERQREAQRQASELARSQPVETAQVATNPNPAPVSTPAPSPIPAPASTASPSPVVAANVEQKPAPSPEVTPVASPAPAPVVAPPAVSPAPASVVVAVGPSPSPSPSPSPDTAQSPKSISRPEVIWLGPSPKLSQSPLVVNPGPSPEPTPTPAVVAVTPMPSPSASPAPKPAATPSPEPTPEPAPTSSPTPVLVASVSPTDIVAPVSEVIADAVPTSFVGYDFSQARIVLGKWKVVTASAIQTDEKQMFAKLMMAMPPVDGLVRYQLIGRSTGLQWVGWGLHVALDQVKNWRGFGAGNSLVVWLTSDPKAYGNAATHLQIYRSYTDSNMKLLSDQVIPESIFEDNQLLTEWDADSGTIRVSINGQERLVQSGLQGLSPGSAVILRALDKAEFRDFETEVQP